MVFNLTLFSRVGFPEVPDITIKVVPTYGEKHYAYTLLQDFMSNRIRAELKVGFFFVKSFLILFLRFLETCCLTGYG